jgi:hypothetical protein
MTRSQPMGGWENATRARNELGPSPFEMGRLWGELSTELKHQGALLQAIATGVERMPERLALRLLEGQRLNLSWSARFRLVRVVVPALLISLLVGVRIFAPDAYVDLIKLMPLIPK